MAYSCDTSKAYLDVIQVLPTLQTKNCVNGQLSELVLLVVKELGGECRSSDSEQILA